jgi:hypothetical protein
MNTLHNSLAVALLGCMSLLVACDRHQDKSAANGTTQPTSMLGNIVKNATDEARKKLETQNISISDGMHIQINGHTIDRPSGKTKAEITPQGDLLIDGKAVTVTPAQRGLLLQYRQNIIRIAEAGMDIGVQGADLGMKAASEAISGIFSGNGDKVEEKIKPEAQKIEAAAQSLCKLLPPMLATQNELAATLSEFRPYARMTQDDISDCMKHHNGNVSVSHADIGAEIRSEVRDSIRSSASRNDQKSPPSP